MYDLNIKFYIQIYLEKKKNNFCVDKISLK